MWFAHGWEEWATKDMDVVVRGIDEHRDELRHVSEEIWKHPEIDFEEHTAHRLLTDFLEGRGFKVDREYTGIATAFRARFGTGKPNVCIICEYDALPEIGHACGHNLIAEAGAAAGLGVKAWLETSRVQGTVTVMGTPAEEGGGGKILLIQNGAFQDVDIAMMAHPSAFECAISYTTAILSIQVDFKGKAAHAAAFPWEGVNALDAAIMAYNNISVLRQQMKPNWHVSAVITNGGVKPNIIPEKSSMELDIRGPNRRELYEFAKKVRACLTAAAEATGCQMEQRELVRYDDVVSNPVLAKLYAKYLQAIGVAEYEYEHEGGWSTDMGNVSYTVPSIHPSYIIGDGKTVNHTREFTNATNTLEAHDKTIAIAKAMALTCVEVFSGGEDLMKDIKKEFMSIAIADNVY